MRKVSGSDSGSDAVDEIEWEIGILYVSLYFKDGLCLMSRWILVGLRLMRSMLI